VAKAEYSVQVAWEVIPANAFVLDGSALDSSKVLTTQFSNTLDVLQFGLSRFDGTDKFGGQYDGLYGEITEYVKRISIRRGRSDNLDQFAAGEATVVLNDPDGRYNPLNTQSPLYPFVIPGRPISIEASFDGEPYGLYRGFVRSIEHDPDQTAKETRLVCQDLFLFLSRFKPLLAASLSTNTGAAIGRVLDTVGWTEPGLRDLAVGDPINLVPSEQGTNTGLGIIQSLLEVERGEFLHGKDGVVRFRDRYQRYTRPSAATLTDVAASAYPATDLTNIKNRATVGNGTFSTTVDDGDSIANFGPSDFPAISSPYVNSAEQAQSLAQWLLKQSASPTPPVRALDYIANKSDDLMENALAREIGDRITLTEPTAGVSGKEFFIEGIEHQIEAGGKKHAVKFVLSKVPDASPIIFGVSRATDGFFSSPTNDAPPYNTPATTPDVFVY
jgi:hypothetical protein